MTLPSVRSTPVLATATVAVLTVFFAYLVTEPGPYSLVAAPLFVTACVLLLITAAKPLWLFPIVAALSIFIYAVAVAGAQIIAADLVVGCIALGWMMSRTRQQMDPPGWRVLVPLLCFLAVCIITVPISQNPRFGLAKIVQRIEFVLLLATTIVLLRDRVMQRRTINAYIFSCLILALMTLGFAGVNGLHRGGGSFLFYEKNGIASFLSIALPLVVARILFRVSHQRARWFTAALILSSALVVTGSRGAWLGTIISIGILMWLKNRAILGRYIIAMAVLLLVANSLLPDDFTHISQLRPTNLIGPTAAVDTGGTALVRLVLWEDSLKLIAAHPLLGVGVGGFVIHDGNFNTTDPHNAFLYMWAELGPVGLLTFIWILITIFRTAMVATRATRGSSDYWLAAGCLTSLISYLIFTLTEPIWVRGDGLTFFLLVGISTNLAASTALQPLKNSLSASDDVPPIPAVARLGR